MRKSGIIIGLLIFSIFQGIGITRTQGLTEVIYEGDWLVDTDTTLSETDLNITVNNNLIISNGATLGSNSLIYVLGDVIVGDNTNGETLWHQSPLFIYGDLIIYQDMQSYEDLYVENTIKILNGGRLNILRNNTKLSARNVILSNYGQINTNNQDIEIKITEDFDLKSGGDTNIYDNTSIIVGGDTNVHSSSGLSLKRGSSIEIGGEFQYIWTCIYREFSSHH